MNRRTKARRHVPRLLSSLPRLGQLAVVPSCFVLSACAPATGYRSPSSERDYQIVINRGDSLSRAVGRGLRERGFRVRTALKGGSPATAYLLTFTHREATPGSPPWLHVRLADTRTGAIVAAVSAPLDSLGATADAQARAIVDSLTRRGAQLGPS